MKKILLLVLTVTFVVTLSACSDKETLYVLNWGEYMDQDLVEAFEDRFNVRVVYDEVGSNEEMEVRINAGTTPYDIAIPSEYMIDKLHNDGLLHPIDPLKLPNLSNVTFFEDATILYENEDFGDYMIPYFFGTIGIIYNTTNPAVTQAVQTEGFGALFNPNTNFRVGMYDSARDAVGAALLHLGYSVNTVNEAELAEAEALLTNGNFHVFGDDNLKSLVIEGNLDMALVYSGDYFDELYTHEYEGLDINFDFYAPNHTNIWIDAFVIPTTAQNVDLAHEFINFFLDVDNMVENADWVGYTPVMVEAYDILVDEYEYDYEHYYPQPAGSTREAFQFVSTAHTQKLNDILNRAKAN